ncbi:hypothetical protein NW759_008653 [Fusarium solani]|nr:hypothetical protein NW759_008653 [Fusarium solani]
MGTSPAFYQQRVSNHLKKDIDKLKAVFPSDSMYFWKFSLLSNDHRDWPTVSEALNEAQDRRRDEVYFHLRCFSEESSKALNKQLAVLSSSTDQEGCAIVHQDLATVLCVEHIGIVSVELHKWDWFRHMLTTCELKNHVEGIEADQVVIFVAYTGAEWTENGLEQFYQDMEPLCAILPHLRLYPSHDEFMAVNLKFTDIAAMDCIAKAAPSLYAYNLKRVRKRRFGRVHYRTQIECFMHSDDRYCHCSALDIQVVPGDYPIPLVGSLPLVVLYFNRKLKNLKEKSQAILSISYLSLLATALWPT